ncbi:N-acetylmuramoyl-L-alanine amidase [Paenibacillus chartarius]|uniref:N-acetylmuramoyl-L-alanine amidase n=1 Tax=Paenibacillus chartarius TaxID=747481 RepID=A0ABV6DJ18_9BACL
MIVRAMFFALLFVISMLSGVTAAAPAVPAAPDVKASGLPSLPPVDVIIDAGHGGVDGGAVYGSLLEKDINLKLAVKLYTLLSGKGVHAVLNRTGDYALSEENRWLRIPSRHKRDLAQRTGLINALQPRLVVSIHLNVARSSSKRGPLIIHQRSEASRQAAALLQEALNRFYGTGTQPVLGKSYYLLNHSMRPTVIAELGYLTNGGDRAILTDPKQQDMLLAALASAIEQALLRLQNEG